MKGSDFFRVERAIRFLIENANAQPSLHDLARAMGLSEFHCHRLFKRWAGITPKDFIQFITLAKAKSLLSDSRSTLDTSLRVGLSGSSRLHDLFMRYEAMTPGAFKAGGAELTIHWSSFDSPLGTVALAATEKGICSLNFAESEREAKRKIRSRWPKARLEKDSRFIRPMAEEVRARMLGKQAHDLTLLTKGTPFQVKVWEALLQIPEGKVTTYQEIANLIGAPKAVRAVGAAVGANPIGYLIPCHRVIKSSGVIGDYHWGSARKAAILAMEYGHSRRR